MCLSIYLLRAQRQCHSISKQTHWWHWAYLNIYQTNGLLLVYTLQYAWSVHLCSLSSFAQMTIILTLYLCHAFSLRGAPFYGSGHNKQPQRCRIQTRDQTVSSNSSFFMHVGSAAASGLSLAVINHIEINSANSNGVLFEHDRTINTWFGM